jgi:hypothetical protein
MLNSVPEFAPSDLRSPCAHEARLDDFKENEFELNIIWLTITSDSITTARMMIS